MANELALTIGNTTIAFPLKGTAAQLRERIRRYATNEGLVAPSSTDAEVGREVLKSLAREIRDGSSQYQFNDEMAKARETISAQVGLDNDLFDED
jgi:hypothetical protein